MKKKCFLIAICIVCCFAKNKQLSAQMDPQFTSNMFTRQLVNPASVGETEMANAFGNWRRQWKNIGPVTFAAYFDTPIQGVKRKHGAALSIISDEAGLFTTTSINLAYAHKQDLWNGRLSVGVQGSLINSVFAGDKVESINDLSTDYHGNLVYPDITTEMSGVKFDIALGLHYSDKDQYYGISLTHLARPTLEINETGSYIYYNRTLNLYGGYNYNLRTLPDLELRPMIFVKTDGKLTQIDLNCNAWYKNSIFAGLSYRFQDALAIMGGMKLKNGILIGGAYDITTSRMTYGGFGSAEVFFNYEFSLSLNSKTNKYKSVRIL